jgi:TetR/AcrR family transcriptional regulator, regulator of biofilm formation and stress response
MVAESYAASETARSKAVRPRGVARREALLEATLRIVADTGADAVTHRRVAEVAKLPLASTTYYFDSKEQLLTAALELAAERDLATLHAIAGERRQRPASPEHAVALILGDARELEGVDQAADRRLLLAGYALLLEAARRPALRDLTDRWSEAYLTAIAEELQRAGSRQPRDDAQLLLAAADGLVIACLARGEWIDPGPELLRLAQTLTTVPQ